MSISASVLRPAPRLNVPSGRLFPLPAPRLLDFEHQRPTQSLYLTLRSSAPAHISQPLLDELGTHGRQVRAGAYGSVRYRLLLSARPGVFSLGGDLDFFLRCIKERDPERLLGYGLAAVDGVWDNLTGCGVPDLTTIAVVQGEAQGGGFEAALSCHAIIAEEGNRFGFPESLFGLFPGMGARELIAARTDQAVADRMISAPHRYPAELLFELGLVDYLVPQGQARAFAEELSTLPPSPAMLQRKRALAAIRYNSLVTSVEHWVRTAMDLPARQLRIMRYLLDAQRDRETLEAPSPALALPGASVSA
jgi:DSF synthase